MYKILQEIFGTQSYGESKTHINHNGLGRPKVVLSACTAGHV